MEDACLISLYIYLGVEHGYEECTRSLDLACEFAWRRMGKARIRRESQGDDSAAALLRKGQTMQSQAQAVKPVFCLSNRARSHITQKNNREKPQPIIVTKPTKSSRHNTYKTAVQSKYANDRAK